MNEGDRWQRYPLRKLYKGAYWIFNELSTKGHAPSFVRRQLIPSPQHLEIQLKKRLAECSGGVVITKARTMRRELILQSLKGDSYYERA